MNEYIGIWCVRGSNGIVLYPVAVEVAQLCTFVRLTELHTKRSVLLYVTSVLTIIIIIMIVMVRRAEWALSKKALLIRINSLYRVASLNRPASLPYPHCLLGLQPLVFTVTFGNFI